MVHVIVDSRLPLDMSVTPWYIVTTSRAFYPFKFPAISRGRPPILRGSRLEADNKVLGNGEQNHSRHAVTPSGAASGRRLGGVGRTLLMEGLDLQSQLLGNFLRRQAHFLRLCHDGFHVYNSSISAFLVAILVSIAAMRSSTVLRAIFLPSIVKI